MVQGLWMLFSGSVIMYNHVESSEMIDICPSHLYLSWFSESFLNNPFGHEYGSTMLNIFLPPKLSASGLGPGGLGFGVPPESQTIGPQTTNLPLVEIDGWNASHITKWVLPKIGVPQNG